MTEKKNTFDSVREWIVEHKLRTVGCLWLSGIAGSIAYNWSQPNMKTSVKIIHARGLGGAVVAASLLKHYTSFWWLLRLHAQALTLAALAGAAVVEYYDHKTGAKAERVAKFLNYEGHPQKD